MSKTTYRCPSCGGHNLRVKAVMDVDLAVFATDEGIQYLWFEEEKMVGVPQVTTHSTTVCGDCLAVAPLMFFTTDKGIPKWDTHH